MNMTAIFNSYSGFLALAAYWVGIIAIGAAVLILRKQIKSAFIIGFSLFIIYLLFISESNWSNWFSTIENISFSVYIILLLYYRFIKLDLWKTNGFSAAIVVLYSIVSIPPIIVSKSVTNPTFLSIVVTTLLIIILGIVIYRYKNDSDNLADSKSSLLSAVRTIPSFLNTIFLICGSIVSVSTIIGSIVNLQQRSNIFDNIFTVFNNLFLLLIGAAILNQMLEMLIIKKQQVQAGRLS